MSKGKNDLNGYKIPLHRILIRPCKHCKHIGLRVIRSHTTGKLLVECEHCEKHQTEVVK